METHDIVVECARITLDYVEGTREVTPPMSILSTHFAPFAKYAPQRTFYELPVAASSGDRNIQEQLQSAKERIVARPGSLIESASNEVQIPLLSTMLSTPPQQAKFAMGRTGVKSRRPSGDVSLPTSPRKKEQSVAFLYPETTAPIEDPSRSHRVYVRSGSLGGPMMALPASRVALLSVMDTSDGDKRSLKKEDSGKDTVTKALSRTGETVPEIEPQTSALSPIVLSSSSYAMSTDTTADSSSATSVEECNVSFDKSSMRLRSYSHGKQRVKKRPAFSRSVNKGHLVVHARSWPDLTVLDSSHKFEETCRNVATPRLSASPIASDRVQPYEQFYRYAFPPWTIQYCVNCQNNSSLEENTQGVESARPVQETTEPIFMHLSPTEILNRHILIASELHKNSSSLAGYWGVTPSPGKPLNEHIKVLQGQVFLLHNQVLFERHNKEMHAERNRRLMGKAKLAFSIEEENRAMKDQMGLQEKEISDLTANLEKLQKQLCSLRLEKHQECKQYKKELKDCAEKIATLEETNGNQNWILNKKTAEINTLTKDLHRAQADLFNKHHDLEAIRKDVSMNEELKAKVAISNEKLLTMGELLHRYQEKVNGFGMVAQVEEEMTALQQASVKETQNLRVMLEVKESQLDAAKRRVHDLENTMLKKDQLIVEQKKLLRDSGEGHEAELKALKENFFAQRSVWVGMEQGVMELQQEIESCRMSHKGYNDAKDPADLADVTPASILSKRPHF